MSALAVIVAAPFLGALLILVVGRTLGRWSGLLMIAAAITSFSVAISLTGAASPPIFVHDWVPSLGLSFRLRFDGFGAFFVLMISGIGSLVGVYALGYIPKDLPKARAGRFYGALSAFMGAMLGLSLADDLMLLFVFWEITSITSFLLIGFWYEQETARNGALTALLVTAMGGLAMMAGFVLIGLTTGTFTLSEIVASDAHRAALAASPVFLPALLLVLAGAFTKSAQVPFHFWLPGAMVAPTPVSTYLHAATMVKAGIFLLGRMTPIFATSIFWPILVAPVGLATLFIGAWLSFRETDLKGLLAYTTIASLGLVTFTYGIGAPEQDVLQILSHATYKGTLFLVAGIVEHTTGTRDLRHLGGLRKTLPITFVLCLLGVLSMGGLPPLFGFAAKEALYVTLLESHLLSAQPFLQALVIALVVVANAFLLASGLKFLIGAFFGEEPAEQHHAPHPAHEEHPEPPILWIPPAVLALGALALGLLAATDVSERLVNAFSSDPHAHLHVSLLPTHFAPLALSLITLALGTVIYRARSQVEVWQQAFDRMPPAQEVWDRLVKLVTRFAENYSTRWQSGSLRWYFSAIIVFAAAIAFFALESGGLSVQTAAVSFENFSWSGLALAVLLVFATSAVVLSDTRLGAALALTATGFLVALMYALYRSPDILLTQILIETVSTIFILLVLYFMPPFRKDALSPAQTAVNVAISGLFGLIISVFVILATSPNLRETNRIALDYLARSLPDAGGRNVVNVIIVDFRAMDTLGEIAVLVLVGLCAYGLLRARRTPA